jgi:hypothetical protein
LTLVIILVNVFFSSRSDVTTENVYEALPELCTISVFLSYCDASDISVDSAKALMAKRGYFESSNAATLIEVYEDMQPKLFRLVLSNIQGLLFVPILLLYLYVIRDFRSKSFYNSLYSGSSRASVYFSKAIMLLVVAYIISIISILMLTLIYANTVFARLPAGYVWGNIFLYALLDIAVLSVPFMLTFVLRKPILSVLAVLIYSFIVRFSTSIIWPAAMRSNEALWAQPASSTLVGTALLSSVVFIAASLLIGWLAFEKADLK